MKKIFIISGVVLLIVLLLIVLLLNGKNSMNSDNSKNTSKKINTSKATIVNKQGEIEELSAKELKKIYDENQANFKKNYAGAYIVFIGTVERVRNGFIENGSTITLDCIEFKEGFNFNLNSNEYDLSNISSGDKIIVLANIFSAFYRIDVRGTGGSNGYNVDSMKKVKFEIVTEKSQEEIEAIKENYLNEINK